MSRGMNIIIALLALSWGLVAQGAAGAAAAEAKPGNSTANHANFKELQQAFGSGPEVTRACLSCHTEAAKQIHKTKHWTWEFLNPENQQQLGKKNVINNFCTAVPSNYGFCTACHVGYGWQDANYDFSSEENVDCLVCHDTTGTYRKLPGLAGHPAYKEMEFPPHSGKMVQPVDLQKVAQNVGKTSRQTCGACHFNGGGGNGVKHGDLDTSLNNPPRYLDVHMEADGLNFTCATCHETDGHNVAGSRYMPTAADDGGAHMRGKADGKNPATCQACHGNAPHPAEKAKLNDHTRKLACQTCHIPEYARGNISTKMSWDWSTAGRKDEKGEPIKLTDSVGRVIYDAKKGDFTFDNHVIPEYIWFNGKVKYTLLGDPLDPNGVNGINTFEGSPDDPAARIWPVKIFRGKQPFDTEKNSLLIPHTWGKDDAAFWSNLDWDKSLAAGMQYVDKEFSGKYGFVSTEMTWPITHMVAPKEDALSCIQCHSKNGRLKDVAGIYMPGRDANELLDTAGWWLALFALVGVVGHGGLRILTRKKG